ncbi:MAG: T9SS type A sorting domain-containing protein, partial [Bacteroidota bacterium]
GPSNVPGRTRALLVDPDDPQNTWFAASVGGGIWKTENRGRNWTHLTPDLPNLWVSSLAMAPSNPNVMYAGTGEQGFVSAVANGDGMYKSIDRGQTWTQLESTVENPSFQTVPRIIVDPADENLVLAAGRSDVNFEGDAPDDLFFAAIHRSTDGGDSWTPVFEIDNTIYQILANPQDFSIQYASVLRQGIFKSIDGGLTWEKSSNGLPEEFGRIELAISQNTPNILYASVNINRPSRTEDQFVQGDVYYSDDGGENWTLLIVPPGERDINLLNGQGNYDNTLLIHPFNDAIVYVGGVDLWKLELLPEGDSTIEVELELQGRNLPLNLTRSLFQINPGGDFEDEDLPSASLLFEQNRTQLAYRFTLPAGADPSDFSQAVFQDFVSIPVEAVKENISPKLDLSFIDVNRDGVFQVTDQLETSDILFIHNLSFTGRAKSLIAQEGGLLNQSLYRCQLVLSTNEEWNPNEFPTQTASLEISPVGMQVLQRELSVLVDERGQGRGADFLRNSWDPFSGTGVHPDMHYLQILPGSSGQNFQLLLGNDGGVYVSEESSDPGIEEGSWTMAGNTYNTAQFYSADKRPGRSQYLGGTQDNGTWIFAGELVDDSAAAANATSLYFPVLGGDGFEAVWNKENANSFIGSIQFNNFGRVIDGGEVEDATNGLVDVGAGRAPFLSRLTNVDTNPDLLFTIGRSGVWRSEDFGGFWTLSTLPGSIDRSSMPDVEISRPNPQIVWAGDGMGSNSSGLGGHVYLSTDNGFSFSPVDTFGSIGPLTGIYPDPVDENTVFVTFGVSERPKILRSTDLGESWEDLSGFSRSGSATGFPNVATLSFVSLPLETPTYWAGTEIGIFESLDEGQTWQIREDFPKAMVHDMKIVDDEVVIATYGRGIWTATIPELLSVEKPEVILGPRIESLAGILSSRPGIRTQINLRNSYDSTQILINNLVVDVLSENEEAIIEEIVLDITPDLSSGIIQVQAISYVEEEAFLSGIRSLDRSELISFQNPQSRYVTDFEDGEDFQQLAPLGLEVREEEGFSSPALQSDHPYRFGVDFTGSNVDYLSVLRVPIIVQADSAIITYRDIAIIETGEPGSEFGDGDFYDFVVVEGSKDLVTWTPLAPGYDARRDASWLAVLNGENTDPVTEELFVNQRIDILETFEPGDTIVIRFRLFSDPFVSGWGWAIDDLVIQDQAISVSRKNPVEEIGLTLLGNPVGKELRFKIEKGAGTSFDWALLDMNGKQLTGLQKGAINQEQRYALDGLSAGIYFLKIDMEGQSFSRKFLKQ